MNILKLTLSVTVTATFVAASWANNAAARNPQTLNVALLPDEDASKIVKDNQKLKKYLEQKLGKQIKLIVTTDYNSMVEAMRFGRIDLGYFGPASYVDLKTKSPLVECFAAKLKNGSTTYRAVVIANAKTGIQQESDIRGKTMAYGDPASTSSHKIPKKMLLDAGLDVKQADYKEVHVGAHDAVAKNVERGNADAGGLSKPIYEGLLSSGKIDQAKVRLVATSAPYPQYPWVMMGDLNESLKARIRQAFYELKDPAILKPLKAEGFAPIENVDYDVIRSLNRALGLK